MGGGRMLGKPLVCDAGATLADAVAGPDFLRIGEAAFALDPLSSSGVQKAVATALQAASVVNTILRRPGDGALALRFFEEEQGDTVLRHAQWTASVYADCRHSAEPFWSERSQGAAAEEPAAPRPGPGAALRLADEAGIAQVATLTGDFVEARPALVHPGLGRPIAFVAGASLPPLLEGLGGTRGQIEARLAARLPAQASRSLVERLIACGALVDEAVPAAAGRRAGRGAGCGP
ncbi:MAG TPA: hypothetical protein VFR28_10585, partial [Allosphingosinicella sp.]|jgi:hypothetical protein|nr:hypothetical protein [Allosphingosinicella sp.]